MPVPVPPRQQAVQNVVRLDRVTGVPPGSPVNRQLSTVNPNHLHPSQLRELGDEFL
jgi:hypothetical protein